MGDFEPKGTVAEWRMLYELLRAKDYGELAAFEELDAALGRDFRANRSPIGRARRELHGDRKTLITVRGVGYRIAESREHADNAAARQREAIRKLIAALAELASANRNRLTPAECNLCDSMEWNTAGALERVKRLEDRQARVEIKIEATAERVSDLEYARKEDLAEIRAELARLQQARTGS
jgi:hypothetical protein